VFEQILVELLHVKLKLRCW